MNQLELVINKIAEELKTSGFIYCKYKDEVVINKSLGKFNINNYITLKSYSELFTKLLILRLYEKKIIDIKTPICRYFTDLLDCENTSILDLITGNTVFNDYLYDLYIDPFLMENNENNEMLFNNYQNLYLKVVSEDKLIEYLNICQSNKYKNRKEYKYVCSNNTNALLTVYLIEKVCGKSYIDVLSENIFIPLNINIKQGLDKCNDYFGGYNRLNRIKLKINNTNLLFNIKTSDYIKFIEYLYKNILVNDGLLKYSFINDNKDNVIKINKDNMKVINLEFINAIESRVPYNEDILALTFYDDKGYGKDYNGNYYGLSKFLDLELKALYTFPSNPVLTEIPYNEIMSLLELETEDYQKEYLSDIRNLIIISIKKNNKIYVLKDKEIMIGFASPDIKEEIEKFYIDVLMIDKRFQRRGYGKILLDEVLKLFKNMNASKARIAVMKENKVALNLYQNKGFKIIDYNIQSLLLEKDLKYEE